MSESSTIVNPFVTRGAVSWQELLTNDVEAAKAFYATAFGWSYEQMEMPGDGSCDSAECGMYNCILVDGVKIGGIVKSPMPEMPPMWFSYVTVDDVEAAKAAVEQGGGSLVWGIRDVPGVGKMFGIRDGQGAMINAIQYAKA